MQTFWVGISMYCSIKIVPELRNDVILGVSFFRQADVQIGYDRDIMYVTFYSTLRLRKAVIVPTLPESIVEGALNKQMCNVKNVVACGNTVN